MVLADQNGSTVTLDKGGISLESAKDLTLKADGDVVVKGSNLKLTADKRAHGEGRVERGGQRQRNPDAQGVTRPDQLRRTT